MKPQEIYIGQILVKYKTYPNRKLNDFEKRQIGYSIGDSVLSGVIDSKGWWIVAKQYRKDEQHLL